ncbi:hypothetical protein HU200_001444 [Digitaria exilis]|uniref:Uncharacterized protein n=1 Tax=Digitaria exilis TaxID=1010633 RepID=A0A835KW80_9POAL|nr:hypothetical protein HU200_001444 [Digitaria exilis]
MTCWAKRSVDCAHGFLIYYAWTVSCGQGTAVVIATGCSIPRSTLRLYPQRYARPGQLKEGVMVAGCFCVSLVLVGTVAEIVLSFLFNKQNYKGILHNDHFMPLIGGIPMAMPAVLHLALALGSMRLCFLGIASRGTVALEDLASMDVILFDMTGTLTCNKPCFAQDKIELFTDGVNKDHAIILAAGASRSQHELYIEPIDAAILSLLDDPEQAWSGVQVLEQHARFFVALKLMFLTTYIDDGNGSRCCVFKGDLAKVAHQCGCSKADKEKISTMMDELALDGYQAIAVGHQVDSCWEFIGLLPYRDDLRCDVTDAVGGLIDLGLGVRVLSESPLSSTKQVCRKLGNLGINVVPAHSVLELACNNREVHLNINGISDLFPEDKSDIVRRLRNFGCLYAMVGYEFLDHDAIGESHIGISVTDAADYTKSESDLVLTQPAMVPVSSAVQISRKTCEMIKNIQLYTVSSTVHLVWCPCLLHLWNFDLSSILALMIVSCNYCTSLAMLFERVELKKSPDRWRVQKIIATGSAFGSYIVLITAIFYRVSRIAYPFSSKFEDRSLMGTDEEISTSLFLQISIVNQAIALFVHSDDYCVIRCPGLLSHLPLLFPRWWRPIKLSMAT